MKSFKPNLKEEEFKSLTRLEKRVAIAHDVIARLKAKCIVAANLELVSADYLDDALADSDISLKDYLNTPIECECCAKGALVLSWIGNFNKYTVEDVNWFEAEIHESQYPKELIEIFGKTLLDAMEVAFEGKSFDWTTSKINQKKKAVLVKYFEKYKTADNCLKAIMNNIIENEGKLVVEDVSVG